MRLLSAVYESARINIPLKLFPERAEVKPWAELDDGVRSELTQVAHKIGSVVPPGNVRLASHRRVMGEFNRGVRDGFFGTGDGAVRTGTVATAPYDWGYEVGRHSNLGPGTDPVTVKQFITATHLLAYEFGQLDQAGGAPLDFIMRNVGPQRADELGELAFALPVLFNYRRPLVQKILDDPEFSLADYHATQSPAPTHLEYLTHGIVALFDPLPEAWVRVAANMALAALPFADGTRLRSEHFQAPEQAADVVLRAPIAAHTSVRRQVDRVLLARELLSIDAPGIHLEDDGVAPVTLWDVHQSLPASSVRGKDAWLGDLVACNVIFLVSRYFESAIPLSESGFQFLRRHFRAFIRGFDSRVEGVLDPRAVASAARGRAVSDGLRRFVDGGPLIAKVSANLQELSAAITDLHHAMEDPSGYVLEHLEGNDETPVAARLVEVFREYPSLPRNLFRENPQSDFFAVTHVKTSVAFDLIRRALYEITRAVGPGLETRDEETSMLARARQDLLDILPAHERAGARGGATGPSPAQRQAWQAMHLTEADERLIVAARLFGEEFETLVRIMRNLVHRFHRARGLGKPRHVFGRHDAGGAHQAVASVDWRSGP